MTSVPLTAQPDGLMSKVASEPMKVVRLSKSDRREILKPSGEEASLRNP